MEHIIDLTIDESSDEWTDSSRVQNNMKFGIGFKGDHTTRNHHHTTKTEATVSDDEVVILDSHRPVSPELEPPVKKQRVSPEAPDPPVVSQKGDILKVKDLFKPKGKKMIANMTLSDDVIERRFAPFGGLKQYTINLPLAELSTMVTRKFMSSVYGGSSQGTFPQIGKDKLAEHGMNDFMYLRLDFQPLAPQIPGRPGLWFNVMDEVEKFRSIQKRVLTRDLRTSTWQYVGQYDVRWANPLTTQEWVKQADSVKNTWTRQIPKRGWGQSLCARIQARKEVGPGRKPTRQRCLDVLDSGRWKNTTPEDIKEAFDTGIERLAVWTMTCVGYDEAFQLELCERFPQWTPPPPPTEQNGKKKETKKGKALTRKAKGKDQKKIASETPVKTASRKRKREPTPESESEAGSSDGDDEASDRADDDDDDSEYED